jgi:hypothetical protein
MASTPATPSTTTGPVVPAVSGAGAVVDPHVVEGNVILCGSGVSLNSDIGRLFITDLARHTEGSFTEMELQQKWGLNSVAWEGLADNAAVIHAARAERKRRSLSGEAGAELARHYYVRAPGVLNAIMLDEQMPARHRIEAAKELRQGAGDTANARAIAEP